MNATIVGKRPRERSKARWIGMVQTVTAELRRLVISGPGEVEIENAGKGGQRSTCSVEPAEKNIYEIY